jgi:hypothetical protein
MTFKSWGYEFEGVFKSEDALKEQSGVYVIWDERGLIWKVLDVGEAENVKARVRDHERKDCWVKNCSGTICYSAIYTPELDAEGRRAIEKKIRQISDPACG